MSKATSRLPRTEIGRSITVTFIVSSDWLSARQYPQWKSEKTVTVCAPEPQMIAPFMDGPPLNRTVVIARQRVV